MGLMEWTAVLGNVGEFVGAIAVVLTLFYLAVQVRHSREATQANTRSIEENRKVVAAQTAREVDLHASNLHIEVAGNPALRRVALMSITGTGPDAVSAEDWLAFRQYGNAFFLVFQAQFLHGQLKVGPPEQVDIYLGIARGLVTNYPMWAEYWRRESIAGTFLHSFCDAIESAAPSADVPAVFEHFNGGGLATKGGS